MNYPSPSTGYQRQIWIVHGSVTKRVVQETITLGSTRGRNEKVRGPDETWKKREKYNSC